MYAAIVMRHVLASVADIVDDREKEHEREHLRTLWMLADFVPICFIFIDLEGPSVSTIFFSFLRSPIFHALECSRPQRISSGTIFVSLSR